MGLDVRPVKGDLGKLPRTAFGETDVAWHTDGDDDVGVNDRGLGDVWMLDGILRTDHFCQSLTLLRKTLSFNGTALYTNTIFLFTPL